MLGVVSQQLMLRPFARGNSQQPLMVTNCFSSGKFGDRLEQMKSEMGKMSKELEAMKNTAIDDGGRIPRI